MAPGTTEQSGNVWASDDRHLNDDATVALPMSAAGILDGEAGIENVGKYALANLHAKGGLGRVWLARDDGLERMVALKEILPERADSESVTWRFLREARITAQLEHPGIVPVYDLGERPENGSPYYTMRFVRGRTLRDTIRDYHQAVETGQATASSFRGLLRAFIGACNAVGYANSRGVLHRDLKPANVAIGDYGEALVLDWGLAKVMGAREQPVDGSVAPIDKAQNDSQSSLEAASNDETMVGAIVGTPAYMAPEQAAGQLEMLDARTDVYGLGAILFELLANRPPFRADSVDEVLEMVVNTDPELSVVKSSAASTAAVSSNSIPPALAAICLKALAKDPEQRYAKATDLAAEIEHWLADEPVAACPDSRTVKTLRWMRRHRTLVGSTAAAVAVAAIGLGVATVVVADRNAALHSANERERAARGQAEENFGLARDAVDQYLKSIADDPQLRQSDFFAVRKRLLETATPFYRRLLALDATDSKLATNRSGAFISLGLIQSQTGDPAAAIATYKDAIAFIASLRAAGVDVEDLRQNEARTHVNLGNLLANAGKNHEALAEYAAAEKLLEPLIAKNPLSVTIRTDMARVQANLGAELAPLDRPKEAKAAFTRAIEIYSAIDKDSPEDPFARIELAGAKLNLALLLQRIGETANVARLISESLELRLKQLAANPRDYETRAGVGHAYADLSQYFLDHGDVSDADKPSRLAVEIHERLAKDFPTAPRERRNLAVALSTRGRVLTALRRMEEAEKLLVEALTIRHALATAPNALAADRTEDARSEVQLGTFLNAINRTEAAIVHLDRGATAFEALAAEFPEAPDYQRQASVGRYNQGVASSRLNRTAEAEKAYRKTIGHLQSVEAKFGRNEEHGATLGACLCNVGNIEAVRGEKAKALANYDAAVTSLEPYGGIGGKSHVRTFLCTTLSLRADILTDMGKHDRAIADRRRAIEVNPDPSAGATLRVELSLTLAKAGQLQPALTMAGKLEGEAAKNAEALVGLARVHAIASAGFSDLATKKKEAERALALLETAKRAGFADIADLKSDPDFKAIRGSKEFENLTMPKK